MTKGKKLEDAQKAELRETFLGILSHDVIVCLDRREIDDSQATRRELIRALFAAIEGFVWWYRTHIHAIAVDIHEVPPLMAMALSETSYVVSENGALHEQVRFIPITSMIRLVTRLAGELNTELKVDFSGEGWSSLNQAIAIRNRITHPKSKTDLEITDEDIAKSEAGFFWLLDMVHDAMKASLTASQAYLSEFKSLAQKLSEGDPATLARYQAARDMD